MIDKNELKNHITNSIKEKKFQNEMAEGMFKGGVNSSLNEVLRPAIEQIVTNLKVPRDEVIEALSNFKNTEIGSVIIEALKPTLEEISKNSNISKSELLEAISKIDIKTPEINVPKAQINVTVPEIKIPTIKVPEIKIPEIKIPKIEVPKIPAIDIKGLAAKIQMPDKMDVEGDVSLSGYNRNLLDNPIPVQLRDAKGKPVNFGGNSSMISGGGGIAGMAIESKQDSQITLETALNALITILNDKVSTDDSLMLLREIRTILYNTGNADGAKRQNVVINLPSAAVTTTLPISGSVTATVASTTITQNGGIDARFQIFDMSHVRYATCIRSNLSFT